MAKPLPKPSIDITPTARPRNTMLPGPMVVPPGADKPRLPQGYPNGNDDEFLVPLGPFFEAPRG